MASPGIRRVTPLARRQLPADQPWVREALRIVGATLVVVATVLFVLFVLHVREVLAVVFLGIVLGVAIAPVPDFLVRWHVPRALSVLLIYTVFGGVVGLVVWYSVPEVVAEVSELFDGGENGFERRYAEAEKQYNLPALSEVRAYLEPMAQSMAPTATRHALAAASGVLYVLTIFVIALLFNTLKDSAHALFLSLLPRESRQRAGEVTTAVATRLRRWAVGELLSMTVIGVITYIGLRILGVPFPFLLAVLAFSLELLPVLGPWLAGIPAVMLALTEGPETALAVVVFYLALQFFESNVVLPLVQRQQTEMPALVILVAVLVGGAAMGILGALAALPVAVIIYTVAAEVVVPWRQRRAESSA
jgi:predicted PurR-regulated permease PerM